MADLTIKLRATINGMHLTKAGGKTLQLIMVAEKCVTLIDQNDPMHALYVPEC